MTEADLHHLIAGCLRNNKQDQKKLFMEMYDYGMSIASRYGSSKQEAEEIANDAFYKMLKNIDKYKPETPFKLWLRRIIINCGIDHFRKYQSKSKVNAIHLTAKTYAYEGPLEEDYLLNMIHSLSPQYRLVFILYVIEGFTHEEIAKKLGISQGSSKSNLSKARANLKKMLLRYNTKWSNYG